jgi:hypothetical protein
MPPTFIVSTKSVNGLHYELRRSKSDPMLYFIVTDGDPRAMTKPEALQAWRTI